MKNLYSYIVKKGKSINKVMYSDIIKTRYNCTPRAFLITDFTDHSPMYPCREDFLEEDKISSVKYDDVIFKNIYFPANETKIEFSDFYHQPTTLETFFKFYIESDKAKTINLEIIITGGIKIWVNGKENILYKPYTRNRGARKNIELYLEEGLNEVVVYFNDIAERDISYFCELINLDEEPLKCCIELDCDIKELGYIEGILNSLYLDKDIYEDGTIYVNVNDEIIKEEILEVRAFGKKRVINLVPGVSKYPIYEVNEKCNSGYGFIKFSIKLGEIVRSNEILCTIYPIARFGKYLNNISKDIKKRKEEALKFIVDTNDASVQRAMAILELNGKYDERVYSAIKPMIDKVNKRDDCSDFQVPSLIMLYTRYKHLIPQNVLDEIKSMILNFRYCYDEVGDDVMCFYSENHIMAFAVSQYLAGNLFPNEIFVCSQRKGHTQKEYGRTRILAWIKKFLEMGLSEWNSNTYIPVNLISFIPLLDLTDDKEIIEYITKALDMLFEIIGKNIFEGFVSATHGRTYEKEIKSDKASEISFINWVAFGSGFVNSSARGAGLLALSKYEPVNHVQENKLNDNEFALMKSLQGHAPTQTYNYRTNGYSLGCALNYCPGLRGGHDQLINICMKAKGSVVRFWVNHPGEKPFSGSGRPSYWAGCGINPHV